MRTSVRLGLTAVAASAVTAVGLSIARRLDDYRIAAWQVFNARNECEDWCPCKCNQQSCGCHEGKRRA